jgi:cytochrome c biogenesis protein CcmG/thiol:disulfide interchange protein DsbE
MVFQWSKMMRTRITAGFFTCLILLSLCSSATYAQKAAPEFEVTSQQGKLNLKHFRGHVLYLDFWASWCAPCKQSFPWLNQMQEKYREQGLLILAINVDKKAEDAQLFLQKTPAHFTIAFDPQGSSPAAYDIKGMPSSVLIDRDGQLIWKHAGFRLEDQAQLEQAIRSALDKKSSNSK